MELVRKLEKREGKRKQSSVSHSGCESLVAKVCFLRVSECVCGCARVCVGVSLSMYELGMSVGERRKGE